MVALLDDHEFLCEIDVKINFYVWWALIIFILKYYRLHLEGFERNYLDIHNQEPHLVE